MEEKREAKRKAPARETAGGRDDDARRRTVERVQTGVRLEKRLLLVLKAIAGAVDLSLGDLIEGIVLHALEGKAPFGPETMARIDALRKVYGLDLTARDSHLLFEAGEERERTTRGESARASAAQRTPASSGLRTPASSGKRTPASSGKRAPSTRVNAKKK